MKKTVLALTMAASVLALSACSDKGNAGDEIIFSSKAGDITQNDLYQEMKKTIGEDTLRMLAIEKVLNDKYETTDKEVQAQVDVAKEQLGESYNQYLAQQGYTEESFVDMMRLNVLQEKALTDGVEVNDEEVTNRIEEMNTELHARHVLIGTAEGESTPEEALEIALKVKKQLEDGADFDKVAKEFSTEPAAQESGGDLGWFGYGKMVAPFWEGAYALDLNTISEPILSEHGYHIIEVTEKRTAEEALASKDDAEEIKKEMVLAKADPNTIVEKVGKLIKDAGVKINDKDFKTALDMFTATAETETK